MKKYQQFFALFIFVITSMSFAQVNNLTNTGNGPYATIQAAINDANTVNGDILSVDPGTYNGNIIVNKSLTIISTGGKGVTIVNGNQAGSELGTFVIPNGVNNVQIGDLSQGFTINGIDGPPGSEKAAIYFQGAHTNITIKGNEIVANGDEGLLSEYNAAVTFITIDNNVFSGQTFLGPNPAGVGFGAQFTLANVPRQLVVMGGGSSGTNTTDITFTNNTVNGVAGGMSITDNNGNPIAPTEQGNTLVTIDANNSTITGNTFEGTTTRYGASLRARRPLTALSSNTFISTGLTPTTEHLFTQNNPVTRALVDANSFDVGSAIVNGGDVFLANGETVAALAPLSSVVYGVNGEFYVGGVLTIQNTISAALSNDVINVAAGTYNENVDISKALTLQSLSGAVSTTIVGVAGSATITINSNDVVLDGFTITNLTGKNGIYAQDRSNLTIKNNIVSSVGTSDATTSGTNLGIGIISSSAAVDNITIENNTINNIVGGDFKSVDAIAIGWSAGNFNITNLLIQDNTISNINSSILDFSLGGRGAYGILINHGTGSTGKTVGAQVLNNNISDMEGLWTHGIGLEGNTPNALVQGNNIDNLIDHKSPTDAAAVMVEDNLSASTVLINSNNFTNVLLGVRNATSATINAEYNWWGDVDPSDNVYNTGGGSVDYDPWVGQSEIVTVTEVSPTTYNFSLSGVTIEFSTLPSGGGTVTVQRFNEAPSGYPEPPAGATHAGLWLDFSSSMTDFSFNATITVDVTGLGLDASNSVMYFNSTANSWVAVSGGSYAIGPPETFTFNTNHFTPFSFINTPLTAYDVFISSNTSATAGAIYPNTSWGLTIYDPNDWDFTTPVILYIVPEVGSVFGASDVTIQWDNSLFSYVNVDETGGIYDGANFLFFFSQLGNTDLVTINASALNNTNFTITNNDYIAKLELNLIMPGYGPINFTSMDFRAFNGGGGFDGVYVTGNGAEVKSYLGDVGKNGDESTGDGLVDFEDLTLWAPSYWSGVGSTGMTNYKIKYDVGPTSTNTVYGLPTVDSKIQFEDLVIFSMSYGLSGDNVYPKINADPKIPVKLELGTPQFAGTETLIPINIKGGIQNVRAFQLKFSGEFGKFKRVEKGSLLRDLQNPAVIMNKSENGNVFVDIAIFGADDLGINNGGELIVLVFDGQPEIEISSANVRNILNGPMAVEFSGDGSIPTEFTLSQNYPNPFNPSTTINYQIATKSNVQLFVFNMLGEKVATLVNELQQPGSYQIEWDARGLSSGIYFYQIKANDFVSVKKMILMK